MLNVSNQASPFQMSLLTQGIIKVVLSVIMVLIETLRPLYYCQHKGRSIS